MNFYPILIEMIKRNVNKYIYMPAISVRDIYIDSKLFIEICTWIDIQILSFKYYKH